MVDDEKRRQVANRILENADKLTRLLRGEQVEFPHHQEVLFAALDHFTRDRKARAEILAQAIELAIPVLEIEALPVLTWCARKSRLREVPAEAANWLSLKSRCLSFGMWLISQPGAPGSSPTVGTELFLLEDARLGEVTLVGHWTPGGHVIDIVRADIVEPELALMHWDLASLLQHLSHLLEDVKGPDLDVRRERLQALVVRAGEALVASTESLEAVVRPG